MTHVPSKKCSKRPLDDDTGGESVPQTFLCDLSESVRHPFICDLIGEAGPSFVQIDDTYPIPEFEVVSKRTRSHTLGASGSTDSEDEYLNKIEKLLFDDSTDVGLVLDHIKGSSGIGYIVPELPLHLCINLKTEETHKAFVSLQALQCLLLNKCFRLTADLIDTIAEALLFCLIDPSSKCNKGSRCYFVKDIAADVLREFLGKKGTLRIWSDILNKLADAFADLKQPFIVHYGAIVASLSLGLEAVSKVVLSHLDEYFEYIHNRMLYNMPSRHEAQRVWDKLVLVCEKLSSSWSQSEPLSDEDCERRAQVNRILGYITDDLAMRLPLKDPKCKCTVRNDPVPVGSDILLEMFHKMLVGDLHDTDEMDSTSSSGDKVLFDSSVASNEDTSDSKMLQRQSSSESSGDDGVPRYTLNSTKMTEVGLSPSHENSTNNSKSMHVAASVTKSEKNEASNLFFETKKTESFKVASSSKTNVLSAVPRSLTELSEPAEKPRAALLGKSVFF